jgi:hypothetical protein
MIQCHSVKDLLVLIAPPLTPPLREGDRFYLDFESAAISKFS